jgi:hypothetical protein
MRKMALRDTAVAIGNPEADDMPAGPKRPYTKPMIITYAEEDILELVGPAGTCSPSPGFEHHEWHCRRRR